MLILETVGYAFQWHRSTPYLINKWSRTKHGTTFYKYSPPRHTSRTDCTCKDWSNLFGIRTEVVQKTICRCPIRRSGHVMVRFCRWHSAPINAVPHPPQSVTDTPPSRTIPLDEMFTLFPGCQNLVFTATGDSSSSSSRILVIIGFMGEKCWELGLLLEIVSGCGRVRVVSVYLSPRQCHRCDSTHAHSVNVFSLVSRSVGTAL